MRRQGRATVEMELDFPPAGKHIDASHRHNVDDDARAGSLTGPATLVLKIELMLIKAVASAFLAFAMLGCVWLIVIARIATYGLSILKTLFMELRTISFAL